MKNILILIVGIAVFLHFFPQPEVTKFYNDIRASMDESFSDFSDTSVRLNPDKILIDLKPDLKHFSPAEVDSLKEITSSRKHINEFYQSFCRDNKRSTTFHPNNQAKICRTISNYSSML
ncbi:hypothetical protein L3081_00275 [Colwellia sp. MSW7]|jgi:hypothetical protein|uniref:Uncharacterized protein n=1 Tax=Colwellia maritima TaxID=2912588 RepID=A0ABS9WW15_9GAMM|nr:hypothetical protein [Colwellia maritima]MCI2282119.1 hypothetical protein [Colwellia maritima]